MNEGVVVFVRGIIAFFTLHIFARFLGKQQVSQLSFFDYIMGISIGSIAATLTTDLSSRPGRTGLVTYLDKRCLVGAMVLPALRGRSVNT